MSTTLSWVADEDRALAADIDNDLRRVEEILFDIVKSQHALLTRASQHLMLAGGKRFRPMLALLTARFGRPDEERVVAGAVACELTHLASLYHDDVMDEAVIRRSIESANARWGNKMAILTGDFLFAQAAAIGVELGPEASALYTRTAKRLIFGQFKEMVGPAPGQDPMEHYLQVVADKTGTLIRASCELGALMAGADQRVVVAVGEFGEQLGIAFQFADDLLDVEADAEQLGKRPGSDLRARVASLPVLYLRASATAEDGRLHELVNGTDLANDDDALAEALALLRKHRAMGLARADLEARVTRCVSGLEPLPDVPASRALRKLAETMLVRRS
jgi:heptaprenyl diphosphate synthase